MKLAYKRFLTVAIWIIVVMWVTACGEMTTIPVVETIATTETSFETTSTTSFNTSTSNTKTTIFTSVPVLTTTASTTLIQDYLDTSIRDAYAQNGMVTSSSPLASKVGLDILKNGGNAFDAAVAIAFALSVVEPQSSSIGGGGMLIGHVAGSHETFVYNYREFAPGAATTNRYQQNDISLTTGAGSFGVPMFVDGMLKVLEDHGTMSRTEIIGPAIELARQGAIVSPVLAEAIRSSFSSLINGQIEAIAIFGSDGYDHILEGDTMINIPLADALESIVNYGREGFYTGPIATAIVTDIQDAGGIVTLQDMERAMGLTEKSTAVSGVYGNYDIYSVMPPGSGISIIQFFNIIEQYNAQYGPVSELDHNSAEYLHLIGSALQLVYGDRRGFIGDPKLVEIPVAGLISKQYAAARLTHYNPVRGIVFSETTLQGNPWNYGDATHTEQYDYSEGWEGNESANFIVVDNMSNAVSATNTINSKFGSGIFGSKIGVYLNDALGSLTTAANSPATISPHKHPISGISPTLVFKDGSLFMAIGAEGNRRAPAAIVQAMLNIMEFGFNVQDALETSRIFNYAGHNIEIGHDIDEETVADLVLLGYEPLIIRDQNGYFGCVHSVIIINHNPTEMHGGADRRRNGKALGY